MPALIMRSEPLTDKAVTDQKNHLGDLGDAYYAAQTFNNSPDERTVIMGWLRTSDNNVYVDQKMPFNQHACHSQLL